MQTDRPNILFIFSDDQRLDTIGRLNPRIQTPHLDRLYDRGVRFTNAFATTAICSPSRAACLSGTYGTRNGVSTLGGPLHFPDAAFPHALVEKGYRTARHKLIRTYASTADAFANRAIVFEELYDLQIDPLELTNLATDPEHQVLKVALAAILEKEKDRIASTPDP